ncbi:MAG: hypothetical protein EDX89_22875 [Acidobacteria bacterium]|nr:MAG: hypothetical protein EDX89_22875 [Acidobacteriota bacterium]
MTIAVDLGMGPEVTAIVVIEGKSWPYVGTRRIESSRSTTWQPVFRAPDGTEVDHCPPPVFHLRHVERLPVGTPYPRIAERVREIGNGLERATLALDATGVGKAAVELFRGTAMSTWVVTITAGEGVIREGFSYRVPKRDVISTAQVHLQSGRLKIARDLPEAQLLLRELQGFRMTVDLRKTNEALAWRERANDDLVLALAVGLWIAERHDGIPGPIVSGKSELGWEEAAAGGWPGVG